MTTTGCMTGERPTLSAENIEMTEPGGLDAQPPTDPAGAAVYAPLVSERRGERPAEAHYEVLRKFGNTRTDVTLARETGRWSLTVGDIRFLETDGRQRTCELSVDWCTDGFDEARVSDVLTTIRFARESAATRLRRDAENATGPIEGSTREVAGRSATCAEIPLQGGNSLYCTVSRGLLAIQDTADVRISLVSFRTSPRRSLFRTSLTSDG